jgi:hypothetical protein
MFQYWTYKSDLKNISQRNHLNKTIGTVLYVQYQSAAKGSAGLHCRLVIRILWLFLQSDRHSCPTKYDE